MLLLEHNKADVTYQKPFWQNIFDKNVGLYEMRKKPGTAWSYERRESI